LGDCFLGSFLKITELALFWLVLPRRKRFVLILPKNALGFISADFSQTHLSFRLFFKPSFIIILKVQAVFAFSVTQNEDNKHEP
jgi:hypothetical protein